MDNPSDLKYTKEHEWVRLDGDQAVVGITAFAQSELGEVVFIELPEVAKKLAAKDQLCVVESTKAASDVYCPIAGTVHTTNSALVEQPSLINSDPYQEGWMVRLTDIDQAQLGQLMSSEQYEQFLQGR